MKDNFLHTYNYIPITIIITMSLLSNIEKIIEKLEQKAI